LGWRQADDSGLHLSVLEETSLRPARIVDAVFQPQDGAGLVEGNPILERRGIGLYGLPESRRASVAVPIDLGAEGDAELVTERPVQDRLRRHPERIFGGSDLLRSDEILQSGREALSLPLGASVREDAPELER